jgi:hypothetical protein
VQPLPTKPAPTPGTAIEALTFFCFTKLFSANFFPPPNELARVPLGGAEMEASLSNKKTTFKQCDRNSG